MGKTNQIVGDACIKGSKEINSIEIKEIVSFKLTRHGNSASLGETCCLVDTALHVNNLPLA